MGRRWHVEHADGREWTRDELLEFIRRDREHDGLWPLDASLSAMTTSDDFSVYLLDNCQAWHWLDDDVRVVWDDRDDAETRKPTCGEVIEWSRAQDKLRRDIEGEVRRHGRGMEG